MTDHEKRASERVPVALRIRLRYQAVDQFISKFAVNVSRGGMFLSSRNPKPPGTRIYFEILLADDSPVIEGNGEVRWIREYDRRRPDQPYGMGIQFVALSDASWPLLERIIVHRRATGEFDDLGIPEPRLWFRRDQRAALDDDLGDEEPGTEGDGDDLLASRLGTVVEDDRGERLDDPEAELDPDDAVDLAEEADGPGRPAAPDGARDRGGWPDPDQEARRRSERRPARASGGYREPPTRRDEIRAARDDAARAAGHDAARAALDDTAPREDFSGDERLGAEEAARRVGLDDTAPRQDLVRVARGRHAASRPGRDRPALEDAAPQPDEDALDTAEHRIDLGGFADAAGHTARRADANLADADLADRRASGTDDQAGRAGDGGEPAEVPPLGPASGSRQDVREDPDVIASVARPYGHPMPTNGAHAERGDDSPDDRLRRELMRALGPSVLMSQTETAADAGPGRESERPPERSTERETGRPSERELAPPSARDPERPSGREPAREPGTPPEGELERPSARESERPPELGPGRPSERSAGRQRTSPPTEPVVRAAMRRARALTSGGSGQLDRELAELLEHSAVPVEISVEAASRELADRLGGAPVERRPTSGPATAARSGQPAGEDGAAAVDDELMPTSGRRTRASTEVEPSPESRAARLLRGE